ncbi:hypothetical protein TNCV_2758021 [Trichonephila clavipes]|nr:hypothetical protein TNCV_2758021 [Trichonephila clavipes]
MTGTLPPLLDTVVGGGKPERSFFLTYGSNAAVPGLLNLQQYPLQRKRRKNPKMQCLKPISSANQISSASPSMPTVSTSSQAQLLPSSSSVTVTLSSESQSPIPLMDTAPVHLIVYIPLLHLPFPQYQGLKPLPACPVFEITTTTSNTIPTTSQDANQTSNPRRKKRPPKNPSNAIKPKKNIEIKMAPHKPSKSAPVEITDEEDMIVYDVKDELEPNLDYVAKIGGISYKGELEYHLTTRLFATSFKIRSENGVRNSKSFHITSSKRLDVHVFNSSYNVSLKHLFPCLLPFLHLPIILTYPYRISINPIQ